MKKIKRILVATDFSPCAQKALAYAVQLAQPLKARLYLLTVLEGSDLRVAIDQGMYGFKSSREVARRVKEMIADKFKRLESEIPMNGVVHENVIRRGRPFLEIVRAAKQLRADMIVMGTRGAGQIQEILLGSTAERVVRKAPCPVLTVKEDRYISKMPT